MYSVCTLYVICMYYICNLYMAVFNLYVVYIVICIGYYPDVTSIYENSLAWAEVAAHETERMLSTSATGNQILPISCHLGSDATFGHAVCSDGGGLSEKDTEIRAYPISLAILLHPRRLENRDPPVGGGHTHAWWAFEDSRIRSISLPPSNTWPYQGRNRRS
jgi:hypothetical protein